MKKTVLFIDEFNADQVLSVYYQNKDNSLFEDINDMDLETFITKSLINEYLFRSEYPYKML